MYITASMFVGKIPTRFYPVSRHEYIQLYNN